MLSGETKRRTIKAIVVGDLSDLHTDLLPDTPANDEEINGEMEYISTEKADILLPLVAEETDFRMSLWSNFSYANEFVV